MFQSIDLNGITTNIIMGILVMLITAFAPKVWLALGAVTDKIRQSVGERRFNQIIEIVRASVLAAEQVGLISSAKIAGIEKKHLALDYIQRELDRANIKIDARALEHLIESQVFDLFTSTKPKQLTLSQ